MHDFITADGIQAILDEHREAGHPHAVLVGVGFGHSQGLLISLLIHFQHRGLAGLIIVQVCLRATGLIGLNDGRCLLKGAGILVPSLAVHGEGDEPAVAEQAVIGPIGEVGADGNGPAAHGNGVHQSHDHHKDGQGGNPVGDDAVNLIGHSQSHAAFLDAGCNDLADLFIPLVGDDGLRVIVQSRFTVLNGPFHLTLGIGG